MDQPLARVLEREPATLGQLGDEPLGATRDDARKDAGRALGEREVRDAADAHVERRAALALMQGADHREGGEVDADRAQTRLACGGVQPADDVATGGDEDDTGARSLLGVDDAEHVVLEHRLLQRHRDVVLRVKAHGRRDLLGVRERRQVDGAHEDPLAGDAQAHALAELVLLEEVPQRLGERLDVGDLAVAQQPGRQRDARGALDFDGRARADLNRGGEAGLDVEADYGLSGWT